MNAASALIRLTRFSLLYAFLNLAFGLVIFVAGPLLTGFLSDSLFNRLAAHNGTASILLLVGALVLVQGVSSMSSPLFGNPWSPMQQKVQVLLRRNLMSAVLDHADRRDRSISSGDSVSRFRDDPPLIADNLDALCDLTGRTTFVVIATVIMWRIDALIAVTLAIPVIASCVATWLLSDRIRRYRFAARASTGSVTAFLGDLLGGQLAIKAAGAQETIIARLDDLGRTRRHMAVRDAVFGAATDAINLNIGSLCTAVVLLVGASAIASGRISIGELALFVVFLDAMSWYPDEISRLIGGLKQVDVSVKRLAALVPQSEPYQLTVPGPVHVVQPPPPSDRAASPEALETLEIRSLSYRYPGTDRGIADISFTVPRGTVVAVTGPIGSGKTTLLQTLLGLVPPDSGEICWNGKVVAEPARFFVPPQVAYTPQIPRLFSESVRENVLQGMAVSSDQIDRAVETSRLEADLAQLVHGLDTMVGPRGVKLSGGQIQRVAAARMLIREPELLVIDDVSSALDAHTEAELWDRLLTQRSDRTILVVSHRDAVLRRADQVLRLDHGRIAHPS